MEGKGEQKEMQQVSNMSSARQMEGQDQSSLTQQTRQDIPLNNVGQEAAPVVPARDPVAPNSAQLGPNLNLVIIPSSSTIVLNKAKLMAIMGFLFLIFTLWMSNQMLQSTVKQRTPFFFHTRQSSTPEIASPLQTQYQTFIYFKNLIELARNNTALNKQTTDEQYALFNGMTYKQFYNLYKVFRIIQLANNFSRRRPTQSNQTVIDPTNLDQPVNKTQYFLDAVNQFQCASCYSFPITATIEYLYKYKYNITVKLSEQQLIDCAHGEGHDGCASGNITKGFEYAIDVGLVAAEDYPYRSIEGRSFKCNKDLIEKSKKYKISGLRQLPPGNCRAIQQQLVRDNVVAAMMNAQQLFRHINGTYTDCRRTGLNHAITIVGQTEKNQWIVRNSWGKNWGDNGYFVMGYGNTCGVCSFAMVPVLDIEDGKVVPYDPSKEQKNKSDV